MSIGRKIAVVVIAVLLTTTLLAGNVLAASHTTVLDPEFVTDSMEEEEGYVLIRDATRSAIAENAPTSPGPVGVDTRKIANESITRSYVKSETETNVRRTYEYLHGNRDQLTVRIDTRPLKDNVTAATEAAVANASIATLIAESDRELEGPINASLLERMTANASSYRAAKADFRSTVRERVLDEAVDQAFAESSNDELLSLVIEDYDPDEYTEAEKEQMVSDRESEIRSALRQRIEDDREDRIESRVDEELEHLRENATGQTAEDPAENATLAIQGTLATALTTDMDYETFQAELEADKQRLATVVSDRARQQLDAELPDRLDLTEDMDRETQNDVEQLRTTVELLDTLAYVIPVVAALLIGLLYLVTRSLQTVAGTTGFAFLSAGLPLYLGLDALRSRIETAIVESAPESDAAADFALGFTDRILSQFGTVSLAFAVAGLALLVVWLVLRSGLHEQVTGSGTGEVGPPGTDGGAQPAPEAESEDGEQDDQPARAVQGSRGGQAGGGSDQQTADGGPVDGDDASGDDDSGDGTEPAAESADREE